jgi:large subunit ribosomal protein L22
MSPTKARQVVDLIRGRHVDDARRVLKFTQRSASEPVGKVLESAVANAEHNRDLPGDELFVARAWVDEGPTLKRFRPRAMGRATRVRKRTCHISVVVGRPEDLIEADRGPVAEEAATTGKQTARRVRKDTAGKPAPKASATATSPASEATPAATSKTAPKETTAKKTTKKKTNKKKTDGEAK